MMRRALALVLPMLVVAAWAAGNQLHLTGTGSDSRGRVDLQIALAEKGRCTKFVDAATGIVAVADAVPGDQSTSTRVCLKASGRVGLHLGVGGLSDVERGCTGQEPAVDPTCVPGGQGELSSSLVQLVSVEQRCFKDAPPSRVPFVSLVDAPLDLGTLDEQRVVCAVLAVRYEPATADDAQAGQTDRAQWRYVFSVSN